MECLYFVDSLPYTLHSLLFFCFTSTLVAIHQPGSLEPPGALRHPPLTRPVGRCCCCRLKETAPVKWPKGEIVARNHAQFPKKNGWDLFEPFPMGESSYCIYCMHHTLGDPGDIESGTFWDVGEHGPPSIQSSVMIYTFNMDNITGFKGSGELNRLYSRGWKTIKMTLRSG
jgi:hypothetical protein